jgi:hypothetical protein
MLPTIPVVTGTTRDLLSQGLPAAHALLAEAERRYTSRGVRLADRISRDWLERSGNPYLAELDGLASVLGKPGLYMLNLSYEWGCTTGIDAGGARLLRTLDWPFDGLGRHVAVLKTRGPAGAYWSVSWPGFAGVMTAVAPGRFAVAINQAKNWHGRFTRVMEWPVSRLAMLRSTAVPPAHLLRRACEETRDYATAVELLATVPVCLPVFFSVAGARPGEGCVIERWPDSAHIHSAHIHGGALAVTNHWRFPGLRGKAAPLTVRLDRLTRYSRGSLARHDAMLERLDGGDDFAWLAPPILCRDTRLACVGEARRGHLAVVGIERMARATEIVTVSA